MPLVSLKRLQEVAERGEVLRDQAARKAHRVWGRFAGTNQNTTTEESETGTDLLTFLCQRGEEQV